MTLEFSPSKRKLSPVRWAPAADAVRTRSCRPCRRKFPRLCRSNCRELFFVLFPFKTVLLSFKLNLQLLKLPFFMAIFFNCMTSDSFSSSTRLSFFLSDWALSFYNLNLTISIESFNRFNWWNQKQLTSSSANLSCSRISFSRSTASWRSLLTCDTSSVDLDKWPDPWNNQKVQGCAREHHGTIPRDCGSCWERVHRWSCPASSARSAIPSEPVATDREPQPVPVPERWLGLVRWMWKWIRWLVRSQECAVLDSEFPVRVCPSPGARCAARLSAA